MAKSVGPNYQDIIKEVEQRRFVPVYLLMGEESYYIDMISDTIAATVLTEEEQGFNRLIIVDGDTCKFGNDPQAFQQVTDMIDAELYGLFPCR